MSAAEFLFSFSAAMTYSFALFVWDSASNKVLEAAIIGFAVIVLVIFSFRRRCKPIPRSCLDKASSEPRAMSSRTLG